MPAPVVAVRAVAAVTIAGIVAAFVWALSQPADAVVGGNQIRPVAFVVTLAPGQQACDALGTATAPADVLIVTIGTYSRPAQPVRLSVDGHSAPVLRRYTEGVVTIPLPPTARDGGAHACLRNLGTRRIALAGVPTGERRVSVAGHLQRAALSLELHQGDPETWGDRAGDIMRRIGDAAGAPLGGATGWLVVLLFVAGSLGAVAVVARWAR